MEVLSDIRSVCRICLNNGEMVSIFDTQITEMIIICCGVQVSPSDILPSQICTSCLNDLNIAYQLRLTSERSEAIIRSWETNSVETINLEENLKDEVTHAQLSEKDNETVELESDVLVLQDQYIIEEESEISTYYQDEEKDDPDSQNEITEVLEETEEFPEETIEEEQEIDVVGSRSQDVMIKQKPSKKALNRPPKKNITVFSCELCNKTYSRQDTFKAHMSRHNNEKTFICSICQKGFVNNFELKRHFRSHTGDKPYPCNFCDKTFADHTSRRKHQNVHTEKRPYACTMCSKSFNYSNVLQAHLTIHTGEKKHKCSICQKPFSQAHHLKKHMRLHNKEISTDQSSQMPSTMNNVIEMVEENNWSSADDIIEEDK